MHISILKYHNFKTHSGLVGLKPGEWTVIEGDKAKIIESLNKHIKGRYSIEENIGIFATGNYLITIEKWYENS